MCICRSRHPSKRAILYTFLLPVEMCMVRVLEDCAEHKGNLSRTLQHGDERGWPEQSEVYIWLCESDRR